MTEKKRKIPEFNIFVLQVSAVAIVVTAAVVLKFIGGDVYTDVRQWYILNFEDETEISEVIPEETESRPESSEVEETPSEESLDDTVSQAEEIPKESEEPAAVQTMAAVNTEDTAENSLKRPLQDYVITSSFGQRENPITSDTERHKGIDLAADSGTGIVSAAAGTVTLVKDSPTYGKYIKIDHGNGLETLYAHCNSVIKKEGDTVRKGETIATVGSTGQSTGPHLHFEVILNGTNLNPNWLINW